MPLPERGAGRDGDVPRAAPLPLAAGGCDGRALVEVGPSGCGPDDGSGGGGGGSGGFIGRRLNVGDATIISVSPPPRIG
ncbi:MAG TPA: hypothetical protein ENK57_23870, partial [Polyangiaceae bacterium]|nr:hypothetical protein [Polyangiaceae bacterium]